MFEGRPDAERALTLLPERERWIPVLMQRIYRWAPGAGGPVLDLGSGPGVNLVALARNGFQAVGVEPFAPANEVARELGQRTGIPLNVREGSGERIPLEDGSVGVVLAQAVMEHVDSPLRVMREARRVLAPGGAFFFHTTNRLCPKQSEIRGFPLFPWYPTFVQRRIMRWATKRSPARIGFTNCPCQHWFTPSKTRRLLRQAGFREVYDHWDMKAEDRVYLSRRQRRVVRLIGKTRFTRTLGDMFLPASAYLAVK